MLIGALDVLFLVVFPGYGAVALVGVGLVAVPVDGYFAFHVMEGYMGDGLRNSMYILRRSTYEPFRGRLSMDNFIVHLDYNLSGRIIFTMDLEFKIEDRYGYAD